MITYVMADRTPYVVAYMVVTMSRSSSTSVRVIHREQSRAHPRAHQHPQPGRERPVGPRLEPPAGPRRGVAPAAVLEPNSPPAKNASRRRRRNTGRSRSTRCNRDSSPTEVNNRTLPARPPFRADRSPQMREKHALGVPRVVPRSAASPVEERALAVLPRVLPATAHR